jgi:hypothetical protein
MQLATVTPQVANPDLTPNAPLATATTLVPLPTVNSPPTPPPANVSTPLPIPTLTISNEERWRRQQLDRQVLTERQTYRARSATPLWWYDPLTGQSLEIGTLVGPFTVQALFTFRPRNLAAVEVPYRINKDFGLTAISPVIVERMQAAGYTESVEAYVLLNDTIAQP